MEFLMPSSFYRKCKKIDSHLNESESIVDSQKDNARDKPERIEKKVLPVAESKKRKRYRNKGMSVPMKNRKTSTKKFESRSELVDSKIDDLKEKYVSAETKRFFKNSLDCHDSNYRLHYYKGFNKTNKYRPRSSACSDLFKKVSQSRLLSPSHTEVSENMMDDEELLTRAKADDVRSGCDDDDTNIQIHNNMQSNDKISGTNSEDTSEKKQFTRLMLASRSTSLKSRGTLSPSSQRNSHALSKIDILKSKERSQQMLLDFGQKMIGPEQCHVCGLTYNSYEKSDEQFHAKYHKKFVSILRFNISSKERILQSFSDGGLIVVVTESDKTWAKVTEIKKHVDADLGFVLELKAAVPCKAFLYVKDNQVVGFCMVQDVRQGYRMLHKSSEGRSQQPIEGDQSRQLIEGDQSRQLIVRGDSSGLPFCCSTIPQPIKCGISRIWVVKSERRKGVASKLIDVARSYFHIGLSLSKLDIAFSDPTPDGMALAVKYMGTPCFLVYSNCSH